MPNWKKVILSGSTASLNSLTVSNGITGSLFGTASYASNGGVTQIVAGTNVSLSPTTGLGAVTINASVTYGQGTNTTASFSNTASWVFNHNLSTQYPIIQTYDLNYNQIIPQSITLTSPNTATITFPGNESGYAVASVGGVGVSAATASYVLNAVSSSVSATASYVTPYEGSWLSYTPVWTAASSNPAINNGTIEGYYKVIGKTCFVRGNIAMGSSTTFGAGEWYVSMPFTASHADAILMTVTLLDNSSAWYNAIMAGARAGFNTKAPIQYVNIVNGTANDVNATAPFTWTTSDRFIWNGSYEIV
jgi:hypothetical protein